MNCYECGREAKLHQLAYTKAELPLCDRCQKRLTDAFAAIEDAREAEDQGLSPWTVMLVFLAGAGAVLAAGALVYFLRSV